MAGASSAPAATGIHVLHLQQMGVNHRGADIRVAQQFLHGANVRAALQQMGHKGVAQGVNQHRLDNAGLSHRNRLANSYQLRG